MKKTIGDIIRSKTNEELVSVFMDAGHDYPEYCNPIVAESTCDYNCGKCCLNWLNTIIEDKENN